MSRRFWALALVVAVTGAVSVTALIRNPELMGHLAGFSVVRIVNESSERLYDLELDVVTDGTGVRMTVPELEVGGLERIRFWGADVILSSFSCRTETGRKLAFSEGLAWCKGETIALRIGRGDVHCVYE